MPAGTKASGGTTLLHDIRPSWSKVCSCLIEERLHVIACNARGYHSATKNFFTISPYTAPSHLRGLITIYACGNQYSFTWYEERPPTARTQCIYCTRSIVVVILYITSKIVGRNHLS
nr:unnamed protein product [Callosobruchus analis]